MKSLSFTTILGPLAIFVVSAMGNKEGEDDWTTMTPVIARDHTSVSMWTETTTYTNVVPATTLTGSTATQTFDDSTFTVTWTKLVTSVVTIPDNYATPSLPTAPRETTLETSSTAVVTAAAATLNDRDVTPSII
ncbi:hypothetical protein SCUP234_00297 [Seiridium cupressi]